MLPSWRVALSLFLLTLCACITRFDVDAGKDDTGGHDGALRFDAAPATDAHPGRDHRSGIDHAPGDTQTRDRAVSFVDSANRVDATTHDRDAGGSADTTSVSDASGNAQIGQHCENRACTGDAICIGDPSNAICRLRCQAGAGTCNAQTEYCSTVTLPDGGPSPNGACLPGQSLGQECSSANCAEVSICVYMGADAAAQSCHARCQPSASDAGCTSGASCVNINGQDGGACF